MPATRFETLRSRCIPLPVENIDTDQIIPARFLSSTAREGFGENLFRDWRFDSDGRPNTSFALNRPEYSGSILVAGKNFGCGSSREHAVWALRDYGFKAVVSSYFADIFMNNALNNRLLPVIVPEDMLQRLMRQVMNDPLTEVVIDLFRQLVTIFPGGEQATFQINSYRKECLLKGLDDIDYLLAIRDKIADYELKRQLL